ncbi:Glutathione S-transferase kappa-like protein [Hapsidospora chrysogenum ATCC 11550]|uniref:Glutathione S-transferase kappa n=1 Tax=Hapsidospora chrysogenum (strain ATCC 11550 / CBS 779.69 / DSM 880 / IAM 14645 / JCM 23072 / IMI 49137) TaxID=857340 RepID=A0A086TBT8_HAPC1|nr:Glutathione S-transferase kappa-like protein [Hapsidospora chrysogenum ATCC 11550]
MAAPKITLYLDTVSPFAYIAYYVLRHDAAFRKCEVTYVPILLGGLMKTSNNQGPLSIPNKAKWINKERQRWAAQLNVPMKQQTPPNFPARTLSMMRALAALRELDCGRQDRMVRALDALFHEYFAQHKPTYEPAELTRVLVGVLGSSAEADRVIEAASSDAESGGKKALKRNTDAAFGDDAFGVPWMVCTRPDGRSESFWGVDRLEQVTAFLGLDNLGTVGWRALL